jgi:hypothetical protein
MRQSYSFAYEKLGIAASRQKTYYDRGLKPREFVEGDWVWRWYPPLAYKKLCQGWTGPYLVLYKITYLTYKIQKSESVKPIVVYVDHLKLFEGKNLPHNWVKQTTSSGLEGISISTDITNNSENTCLFSQNNDLPVSPKTIPFVPISRRERIIKYINTESLKKAQQDKIEIKPREVYSP